MVPGRPQERPGDGPPRWMAVLDRIRLTDELRTWKPPLTRGFPLCRKGSAPFRLHPFSARPVTQTPRPFPPQLTAEAAEALALEAAGGEGEQDTQRQRTSLCREGARSLICKNYKAVTKRKHGYGPVSAPKGIPLLVPGSGPARGRAHARRGRGPCPEGWRRCVDETPVIPGQEGRAASFAAFVIGILTTGMH
jgi:hypothetical protein